MRLTTVNITYSPYGNLKPRHHVADHIKVLLTQPTPIPNSHPLQAPTWGPKLYGNFSEEKKLKTSHKLYAHIADSSIKTH